MINNFMQLNFKIKMQLFVESRKMVQMNWFASQKQRYRCREQMQGHQGGGGWDELGDWD